MLLGATDVVHSEVCCSRDLEHPLGVAAMDPFTYGLLGELLRGELVDRLEHPVPLQTVGVCAPSHQALVEQGGERVEIGVDGLLGYLERAAASEDREAREEALLVGGQEVV
jgi:hypothetical protein